MEIVDILARIRSPILFFYPMEKIPIDILDKVSVFDSRYCIKLEKIKLEKIKVKTRARAKTI